MPRIKRTKSTNKDFQSLIKLLDYELRSSYPDTEFDYSRHNIVQAETKAIVLFKNDIAVGSGAFKELPAESTVELKRIFVLPDFRGKGYSKLLLAELETWAAELGYQYAKLETGNLQKAAIGLYEKNNYRRIPNYPPYENVEDSLCFKKELR